VLFIDGNHDAGLRFPEVQTFVRSLCGGASEAQVLFPGFEYVVGRVHIEHGQQRDAMFRIDPEQPIIEYEGKEILALSWGAAALLETAIPLQPLLYFHDRLKPKQQVFELMPEVKELLVGLFWNYWTRDYWKDFFGSKDPTKKLTWTMLKEVVWRLTSKEVEVSIDVDARKALEKEGPYDLWLMGHLHQPALYTFGHRKLILSGCLRNEYMMLDEGKRLHAIPKSYVEVYLRDGAPLRSNLLEIEAPPAPEGYLPDSIFDVLPEVRRRLEEAREDKEQQEAEAARAAQEKKEAREAAREEKRKARKKKKGEDA
jgi:UDP-2,3-diacylglucosamine pyrophosphatase LpxH